jgi:hypothetical protein
VVALLLLLMMMMRMQQGLKQRLESQQLKKL